MQPNAGPLQQRPQRADSPLTQTGGVRSSAWEIAIDRGQPPPLGIVCPVCTVNQPPIYFDARRQACFDCHCAGICRPRRFIPSRNTTAPLFPALAAAELATIGPAERRVYEGVRAGLSYAAIGRAAGVHRANVQQAAKRLQARIDRAQLHLERRGAI